MNNLTVETEDTFASLLDFAANNDVEGFKRYIERDLSGIDEVGLWYGRRKGSKQMVLEPRTPLMVAATYGSIDIVKLIISFSDVDVDVNQPCGHDKITALHCAAWGGSVSAVDVVKLLLDAGANPNLIDANGHCPVDVIVVPPKFQELKFALEELLATNGSVGEHNPRVSMATSNSNSPPLSPFTDNRSLSFGSDSTSSPKSSKFNDVFVSSASEKKEYPIDPSLPDIKNSIYSTDECSHSRSGLVLVPTPMIGPSAHLFILAKTLGEGTRGNIIIAAFHVLIFGKGLVEEGICVSMLMGFLSVGSTQLSIGPGFARTVQVAIEEYVFLLTHKRNSDLCMSLPVLLCHRRGLVWLPLMGWILLQP